MYINSIKIENFRVIEQTEIDFIHPEKKFTPKHLPKPKFPNLNVVLGTNGFGKTSLLKCMALSCLGPAVENAGIYPFNLIRKSIGRKKKLKATLFADFIVHEQDQVGFRKIESRISIEKQTDIEILKWRHSQKKTWHPIYNESSDAFFFVGYGATRIIENQKNIDFGRRSANSMYRAQRIKSLFEETYSLVPLNSWLPSYAKANPGRYSQIKSLINLVLEGRLEFQGKLDLHDDYLFAKDNLDVPYSALSDGYRAFVGWLGDFLFHVTRTCPSGKKLTDNKGIVMVDEIDLHIHPEWQKTILSSLATHFPNIQFIVTTHSPLIIGSVEWVNIINMVSGPRNSSVAKRIKYDIEGLDSDQILLTPLFNLTSTRTSNQKRTIDILSDAARDGDINAAKDFLSQLF